MSQTKAVEEGRRRDKLLAEQQREIRALNKHIKILEEDWYSEKEYEEALDRGLKAKEVAIKSARADEREKMRGMGKEEAIKYIKECELTDVYGVFKICEERITNQMMKDIEEGIKRKKG